MSQPFVGEVRCFGFNFAPRAWAQCNGQLLPIAQFQTLFALLGTTYGGDGRSSFGLPNLQGRAPMHWGNNSGIGFNTDLGESMGEETVTLLVNEMPAHQHTISAATVAARAERTDTAGSSAYLSGSRPPDAAYQNPLVSGANAAFSPLAIGTAGGSQPHDNMQPFLVMNFCISLDGVFPSRN